MLPLIKAFLVLIPVCCLLILLAYCFRFCNKLVSILEVSYPVNSTGFSWEEEELLCPAKVQGLSASYLEKLAKVTGKDLVMGTDECAVCLEEIESDQSARMFPGCNHGFHLQCADIWLVRNATCPMCRAPIGPEFFDSSESNPC